MKMREYINIVESATLEEGGAGPARLTKHIRDGSPFFMISAQRDAFSPADNAKRTKLLKDTLASHSALSFIETSGESTAHGTDEASFFVLPRSPKTNVRRFIEMGNRLRSMFQQEAIVAGDGEKIMLIDDAGQHEVGSTLTFNPATISDLLGSSSVRGRPFSFTDKGMAPSGSDYGEDRGKVFDYKGF